VTGRDDRGAATVLAIACLGLVLLVGAGLGVVAAMVADHRRAQAAADLAALAGAAALHQGDDACRVAQRVASANDADLTTCSIEGADVVVTVTVAGPRWLGQSADLEGRARAGPG